MNQILIALSLGLHALATIVLIGHYLLLSLIYLPVFEKNQPEPVSRIILSEISKRSRVWMYKSLAIFTITGIYLTLANPSYLGLGNFGNLWAILMLIKHILIVGMIGAGFYNNAILRVGPQLLSNSAPAQTLTRFKRYCLQMASAGVLVLLLTAISQVL